MAHIVIVGDGPGGLSAALFLAKAGHTVTVFGRDQTPMHHAQLYNYLGVRDISGSDFQLQARRHATAFGAGIVDAQVTAIQHGRHRHDRRSGPRHGGLSRARGRQGQSTAGT